MRNLMDKNEYYGIEKKYAYEIGYFRVPPGLCIKTRLSALPLTEK